MTKGKSKAAGRTGSQSNNQSRASASDRRHDERQMAENKSIKAGSDNRGKQKKSARGEKSAGGRS